MYNKIKGAAIAHGLTMQEFWKKTGFYASTLIRRCENGKLTVADVKIIRDALQLSRDEMLSIFFER